MTHEDAFLADIIANPDDDGLRLIYADYLDERGDPRGEFIRVQTALATLPPDDSRRPGLKTSERRLQEKHERKWAAPLPGLAQDWGFRRGFVEFIAIPSSTLLQHADAVFRSTPVRELRLEYAAGNMARLALCAHLGRLTVLDLDGSRIGDDGLLRLLASPYLTNLRTLGLSNTELGADDLRALAGWPPLAGLTSLDLKDNNLGDEAVEVFLASSHLVGLEAVDFSGNPISESLQAALKQRFGQRAYRYSPQLDDTL